MYRVPSLAVFLAAAAFPSLEAQMRAMQRPGVATRISVGSRFRAVHLPPVSAGVMRPAPVGRRASLVRSVAFRHNVRFRSVFGNSCFSGRFVEPFFCRQFFFHNRHTLARNDHEVDQLDSGVRVRMCPSSHRTEPHVFRPTGTENRQETYGNLTPLFLKYPTFTRRALFSTPRRNRIQAETKRRCV
jgi:hypothetical protein